MLEGLYDADVARVTGPAMLGVMRRAIQRMAGVGASAGEIVHAMHGSGYYAEMWRGLVGDIRPTKADLVQALLDADEDLDGYPLRSFAVLDGDDVVTDLAPGGREPIEVQVPVAFIRLVIWDVEDAVRDLVAFKAGEVTVDEMFYTQPDVIEVEVTVRGEEPS